MKKRPELDGYGGRGSEMNGYGESLNAAICNIQNLVVNGERRIRRNLPQHALTILNNWLCRHPHPNVNDNVELAEATGLTHTQISNWLINARRRTQHKIVSKRDLGPSLSGSIQKRNKKKMIPPHNPKLKLRVEPPPPPPTNIIAAVPVSYTVFPTLALLSRICHDHQQGTTEEGGQLTFQPVQGHPAEVVSTPPVLDAAQETELVEQMSRL
ncbi:homeobox protein TGIF1-like [Pelobates fuscus]|uniref:homeobox protein TGIF1-like n=1 Tax=Pelobates fuscus TaxID=191477 RepID=UPI002FE446F0